MRGTETDGETESDRETERDTHKDRERERDTGRDRERLINRESGGRERER